MPRSRVVRLTDPKKGDGGPPSQPKLDLSENALKILEKRYLCVDQSGKPTETPRDLFWRVAKNIAEAEELYGKSKAEVKLAGTDFYKLLVSLKFLPNSPCLRGAGRKLQQLSACFVLPIEDNMESIFNTLKNAALIHKTGGGTGFDFSSLRPKGDIIHSTGNRTPGPLGFLRLYNSMAGEVTQGGVRMGANMGMLRADHPDIEEFISSKADFKSITNFNISVSVPDKFMRAVEKNRDYALVNPRTKKTAKKVKARELFEKICHYAWQNGDPGMIFIDRINDSTSNPTPSLGKIEATNPCGEQPLLPYESCVLGSINLAKHIKDAPKGPEIDWDELEKTIQTAVYFLDNIIDQNVYTIPEVEEKTKSLRRIGLGVMGFADLLIVLGIPYNSKESHKIAEKLMKFINSKAAKTSVQLAKERGAFPRFKDSIDYKKGRPPMRNVARTTIAPTGTISIIADCSSGIEPIFALVHRRKSIWQGNKAAADLLVVDKNFENIAKKQGFYSKELMEEISKTGSVQHIDKVPEDVKKVFVTAHDLKPEDHIKIQAAFQKSVDNAVSKTINFPNSATIEDVKKAYVLAYKMGCKGITIYRDGSRELQVLSVGDKTKETDKDTYKEKSHRGFLEPKVRPEIVHGTTYKTKTAYGNLYVTINQDEKGLPFEVFAQMGKAGGFFAAKVEAISRLISLALRSGITADNIIDQLKGIRGPSPIWNEGKMILSVPDAIAQVIEKHLKRDQAMLALEYKNNKGKIQENLSFPSEETTQSINAAQMSVANLGVLPVCPDCGSTIETGEGCVKCHNCGWSKCS